MLPIQIIGGQPKLAAALGRRAGKLIPQKSKDIPFSPVGIGLEKADAEIYDPSAAYPYIGDLGVKWVRIQSGWARCEKERGVYDFGWLDGMVDGISAQGASPWMCLCYGNPVYDTRAPAGSRACGIAPLSEEVMRAWLAYVLQVVRRYKGRVRYYEIWNEPDGTHCWKSGVNGKEYGRLVRRTAECIKKADAGARILAGSMCNLIRLDRFCGDIGIRFDGDAAVSNFFEDWLSEAADCIDYVTVHLYRPDPEGKAGALYRYIRKTLGKYRKGIGIVQGETGTHAAFSRAGALNAFEWTDEKQAKYLLRRLYTDIVHGAFFTSYFSMFDMYESHANIPARLTRENFGFYGVLGAVFDGNGNFTGGYYRRPSYYALQNLCAIFSRGAKKCGRDFRFAALCNAYWGGSDVSEYDPLKKYLTGDTFRTPEGKKFEMYYMASSVLNVDYGGTVSLIVERALQEPVFIDTLSGKAYKLHEENVVREDGKTTLLRLPLKDYPCIICDLADTDLPLERME